jgi:hypothetical protein
VIEDMAETRSHRIVIRIIVRSGVSSVLPLPEIELSKERLLRFARGDDLERDVSYLRPGK